MLPVEALLQTMGVLDPDESSTDTSGVCSPRQPPTVAPMVRRPARATRDLMRGMRAWETEERQ